MKTIHLICNAHLDPVWLWEWEEGAAEAMGTFRAAADLCEQFDGFVFNHNEAILYRWVEEYEPSLFRRIRALVRRGKWHIMGGWHLQPDCNMPSGESFVRQILLGRDYFREKFGVAPTTAINFDPFGHTRGLVQILAKSGYDSYLFCRPGQADCPLERDEFVWEGYDGSRVTATRMPWYNSAPGRAHEKVRQFLRTHPGRPCTVLPWGVGNHGGGPSRRDLVRLSRLMRRTREFRIRHSTPEAYFAELRKRDGDLPVHRRDLNPWAAGCYTSQIRIKQKHRLLENTLFMTEKMAAAAWAQGLMAYPQAEVQDAMRDLATCEFHDILPGSSIQPVEEASLRMLDHGLEILSRVKARAFYALSSGQPRAGAGEIPILVYNPHPFPIETDVECEFQLAGWVPEGFAQPAAHRKGQPLPTQAEQELSHIDVEWRKRVAFRAVLEPSRMNRFDCRLTVLPRPPVPRLKARDGRIRFRTKDLEVVVNTRTGLLDRYRAAGRDAVRPGAMCPLVMDDYADPWGMQRRSYRRAAGRFKLLPAKESARFSGVAGKKLPAVRVIEDGPVRSVVEAVFGWRDSRICQRYILPKQGTEIGIETRVHWNEKDRMLKLSIPTPHPDAEYRGQVAYGADTLPSNGDEVVAQKWVAAASSGGRDALTVINDGTYGSDFLNGELRLTLLRAAAYSAHPMGPELAMPPGRYSPRMEQGERLFHFWLNAGPATRRLAEVDREALAHNERPMAISYFPSGGGGKAAPFLTLSDRVVQVAAARKAERGGALVLRLFNPTARKRSAVVSLPFARMRKKVALGRFQIRTYRIDVKHGAWVETDLMERPLR